MIQKYWGGGIAVNDEASGEITKTGLKHKKSEVSSP